MDIGNKYSVTELRLNGRKKKHANLSFTGTLVEEYTNFYLFDCGPYKTTLTKSMLKCGDYAVKAVV